ncbi:MAG: [NiFe]-hydrogenase assembly chaperone HybE [Motiliproteus sp.]|nr:[NiFe]-hydrogenase assembly chaperone HybE [Motiliproteus sp.]MCW9051830.1 [NiFe]-hydrogenase assembly chaperone HybE [Motiliproteus sp.]
MTDNNNFNTPVAGFEQNPSAELERIYNHIYRDSMQEVPVVNHAIEVEAIGFSEWEGHWLGVMLTPWFMNIMVIPKTGSPWPQLEMGKGKEVMLSFPQGEYKFSARDDEGIGSYLSCSLASPVNDWKSHPEAKRTVEDVLHLMKSIPLAQVNEDQSGEASTDAPCMPRRSFIGAAV